MDNRPKSGRALVYFVRPTAASRKWLAAAGRVVRLGCASSICRVTRLEATRREAKATTGSPRTEYNFKYEILALIILSNLLQASHC